MKIIYKNKKGQGAADMILWIVIVFVLSLFLGVFVFGFGLLNDSLSSVETTGGAVNISDASNDTVGQVNDALLSGTRNLGLAVFFGMILSMFLTNVLIRKIHPSFFILELFIVIVAIVLSVPISNSYQALLTGNSFSASLLNLGPLNNIMINLPKWVSIIGIFGLILSMTGIIRRGGTEEIDIG